MSGRPAVTQALLRVDLHNHSYYSPDSIISPEGMLRRATKRGVNVLAITDHNTTRGGREAQTLAERYPEVRVIVGEEVRAREGEVLGLFLTEDIPRDLSASETIDRIHAQGGLAGAPHAFDPYRHALREEGLLAVVEKLDFIEGLNARMIKALHNQQAREFAAAHNLPMSAASDAHSPREIGRCYVEMADFSTPAEFLESLRAGKLAGVLSSPLIHLISRYSTITRKLGIGGPPK